jgi:hypothetical protein
MGGELHVDMHIRHLNNGTVSVTAHLEEVPALCCAYLLLCTPPNIASPLVLQVPGLNCPVQLA